MRKYGLPTYPIQDGMVLGHRDLDELEWLLAHGAIQSDIYRYRKIVKISDNEYHLLSMSDSRVFDREDVIAGATTLQTLVEMQHLNIQDWYWYGHVGQ